MRHTVYRLFWAWDFDKEEQWLNEMSAKGFQLVSVSLGKYVFEDGEKGRFQYKIELLDYMPSNSISQAYIRFIEDTGAEHVGTIFRWVYFRKEVSEGTFEIYSDIKSRIKHYNRIRIIILAVLPINVISIFTNFINYLNTGLTGLLIFVFLSSLLSLMLGIGIYKVSSKINRLKEDMAIME